MCSTERILTGRKPAGHTVAVLLSLDRFAPGNVLTPVRPMLASIFFGSSNANIARILYQKLHVLALREIVTDFGTDRGILVSESGFQAGAVEAASFKVPSLYPLLISNRGQVRPW